MSKWNGKACHLCGLGTLHDGKKTTNQYYRERCYTTEISGAFCDHCGDGVIDFDPAEEERWLSFRRQVDADPRLHAECDHVWQRSTIADMVREGLALNLIGMVV